MNLNRVSRLDAHFAALDDDQRNAVGITHFVLRPICKAILYPKLAKVKADGSALAEIHLDVQSMCALIVSRPFHRYTA